MDRLVRACTPNPGAWTTLRGARVKLGPVTLTDAPGELGPGELGPGELGPGELGPGELKPGELTARQGQLLAGTGSHPVVLGTVQPEGKRPMQATEWARGLRLSSGERLV